MEDIRVSFTIKHESQVIKLSNIEKIKDHPIFDVLEKNLLILEKKMYSEAATTILNDQLKNDSVNKIKVIFK
ncbi:hypothetical protein BHF71_10000 [Vulcanibacillus modesticaldus]|uniref:Uncharacterized protein n=1 Tax=Vulcanibacillus modesticaldus TaxID=337097 RepID=A0A1D2YTZ4_9BACI|nr:hypothetical protein [Vulcanibacillus modesticaldus]OEF99157.1 hypothetical protein BHF71_10000 [Vulcanibacillus modesticaldus]